MNKIYSEPILKAESLVEGVKAQADLLAKKGIVIDVDALSAACRALEQAGAEQDAAEHCAGDGTYAAEYCRSKCLDTGH